MAKKSSKKTSAKKNKKTSGVKVKKTKKKSTAKNKLTAVKKSAKKSISKKSNKKKSVSPKKSAVKSHKEAVSKSVAEKHKTEKVKSKSVKVHAAEEELTVAERRERAIKKIKGYSKKDLDQFREIIAEKRDEIIEQLQNLKEQMLDPTTGEYINENSPYSLHMAEQGTDAMEREKTFLYAQRENKFLGYLEDALKRIDNGTYGICVECIEEPQNLCETCPLIPKERLFAVPHSQHCLPIKQRQEKK